jgi:RimJ/RimL family protein N-acetyltransferase
MTAVPAPPPVALPVTRADKAGRMFTVRDYTPEDRPGLERFYTDFRPKRGAQGLPPEGEARIRRWLDAILPAGTHLIVEMEGRLAGHAMLMPTSQEGAREYAIFLDEGVRGNGVGTEVNRVTVELARALNLDRLWLSVEPHNRPALRSYQKAGFRFRRDSIFSSEIEMELDLSATAA